MPKMKKYTNEDMVEAISEVRARGASIRAVERKYNIPHATLMDKLKCRSDVGARTGPKTVLTKQVSLAIE